MSDNPISETFEQAWARQEKKGYQYGPDALEQVRFGWELRGESIAAEKEKEKAKARRCTRFVIVGELIVWCQNNTAGDVIFCPLCDLSYRLDIQALNQQEELRVRNQMLRQSEDRWHERAAVAEDQIDKATGILFDVSGMASDPEHTITCHAEDLPEYYRRLAKAVEEALTALQRDIG